MAKLTETNGLEICRDLHAAPRSHQVRESMIHRPDCPQANKRLIMIVDTSGSMTGDRIASLNGFLARIHGQIKEKYEDAVAIDALSYNTHPSWVSQRNLPLRAFGLTNYGAALRLLQPYGKTIPEDSHCAVVFTSDGHPTDQYRDELGALRTEKWFSTAIKLAVSLGDDANIPDLGEIVDSPNSVIHAADQFGHALDGYVIGAVASLFLTEEGRTAISGRNLCEWNDHDRINESLHWSLSEDGTLTVHGFIIPDSYTPNTISQLKCLTERIRFFVLTKPSEVRRTGGTLNGTRQSQDGKDGARIKPF